MQRNLTLLLTLALTLSLANANPNVAAHHRILRKRQRDDPEPTGLIPLIGAGADPEAPVVSSATPTSTATSTSQASATSSATSSASSGLPSLIDILSSQSSAASSSISSTISTSSSIPVSTSSEPVPTSATSQAPAAPVETPTEAAVVTNTVKGVTTLTTTGGAEAQNTAPPDVSGGAVTKPSTIAITVLIAIAASVGGIVILWTLFRKWQSSRKVDARMQPIDWQPGSFDGMDGAGIPGEHRRHSGSSFRSSNHGSDEGHGSSHGHGARTLGSLPAHDFTAGNPNLAPVGGYADLSRGPSLHQPQMAEMQGGVTPLNFKY